MDGSAEVTIDIADRAGNKATFDTVGVATLDTAASRVTIDYRTPDIFDVSIASSNTNARLAKMGDTITVSFRTPVWHKWDVADGPPGLAAIHCDIGGVDVAPVFESNLCVAEYCSASQNTISTARGNNVNFQVS